MRKVLPNNQSKLVVLSCVQLEQTTGGKQMNWKKLLLIGVIAAGFGFVAAPRADAGLSVGIGIGAPLGYGGYGYGGYGYGGYGYARPVYYSPFGYSPYGYSSFGYSNSYYQPYTRVVV